MKNLGVYALEVVRRVDEGAVVPMDDATYDNYIRGKGLNKLYKEEFEAHFTERFNRRGSGGLTYTMLEDACGDVPEILRVIGEIKEAGASGIPRIFADGTDMHLSIFTGLDDTQKAPYLARVIKIAAEDNLIYIKKGGRFDTRKIYAICFGIYDTDLELGFPE